jgi:tetratricopeptide (TPR) repeat protein
MIAKRAPSQSKPYRHHDVLYLLQRVRTFDESPTPFSRHYPELSSRQLLEYGAQHLPSRWRALIVRCYLGRELNRVVAMDLGISMRHFYRERRKAIAMLGNILQSAFLLPPLRSPVVVTPNDLSFAYVDALAETGNFEEALEFLETIVGEAPSMLERVRIAIYAAGLCISAGAIDQARLYNDLIRQSISGQEVSSALTRAEQLQIETVRGFILAYGGHTEKARHGLERAIAQSEITASLEEQKSLARATVRARLLLMELLEQLGAEGKLLNVALQADSDARKHDLEPLLRSQADITLIGVRMFTAYPTAVVMQELYDAFDFARSHRLAGACADIAMLLCVLYIQAGEYEQAVAFGRRSLDAPGSIGSSNIFMRRQMLAIAYLRQRNIAAAREVSTTQTNLPVQKRLRRAVENLIEAQTLFAEGNRETALRVIAGAVDEQRRIGTARSLAAPLKIQGELQAAAGLRGLAARSIDEAIRLLRSCGHPFVLMEAYTCSAGLTRNSRYARFARELSDLFRITTSS